MPERSLPAPPRPPPAGVLGAFDALGRGAWSDHGCPPGCCPVPPSDLADAPAMLDELSSDKYKKGPETPMKHVTCIEDLRQLHKRRVPKAFFDYADRGSYSEDTLRANR